MNNINKVIKGLFENFAKHVTKAFGSALAFMVACFIILSRLLTLIISHFSNTWQLVFNSGIAVTFLMVFLIRKQQHKHNLAINLKLNELIAAHKSANNDMINLEDMSIDELKIIQKYHSQLTTNSSLKNSNNTLHSIDEKI